MPITQPHNRNEVKEVKFHHKVKRFYHKNLFRKIYTVAIIGLIGANIFSMMKYASFADESLVNETPTQEQGEVVTTMGVVDGHAVANDKETVISNDSEKSSEQIDGDTSMDSSADPQNNEGNMDNTSVTDMTSSHESGAKGDDEKTPSLQNEVSPLDKGEQETESSAQIVSDLSAPVEEDDTNFRVADVDHTKDIIIQVEVTETGKNLTINKYFANSYTVDWESNGNPVILSSDIQHSYGTTGEKTITLSLTGGETRWRFTTNRKPLIPKNGTTVSNVKIMSMPSLEEGFGASATIPGDLFFCYFNGDGAITELPEGSFKTENIETAGNSFFYGFNYGGVLTELPVGSFKTEKITTVGPNFFGYFNYDGAITELPVGSFKTENIKTVETQFFIGFNYNGAITELPEGSFKLSPLLDSVEGWFFGRFNEQGKIRQLPEGSFDTSHIKTAGALFFCDFNNSGALERLPEGSFDTSNITTVNGDGWFFMRFNQLGAITYLPDSFKMSSVGASTNYGYQSAFYSPNYPLNKNVSDLVAGITTPSSSRGVFSDNQPGRCGVHGNWLSNSWNVCVIIYDANGGNSTTTGYYSSNTTNVSVGSNISRPQMEGYVLKGRYTQPEGGEKVENIIFPAMDGQTLYAHRGPMPKVRFRDGDEVIMDEEEYRDWCGNINYGYEVCEPNLQYDGDFSEYLSQKEGWILEGRYTDKNLTEKFDFDNMTLDGDLDLYAKWVKCEDGYKAMNYKVCVLESAGVYYEDGYIKVTDGEKSIYVKDKNAGGVSDAAVRYQKLMSIENSWRNQCPIEDYACIRNKYLSGVDEVINLLGSNYDSVQQAEQEIYQNIVNEISGNLSSEEKSLLKFLVKDNDCYTQCMLEEGNDTWNDINQCKNSLMISYIKSELKTSDDIDNYYNYLQNYFGYDWNNAGGNIIQGYLGGNYYFRGNNNGVSYNDLKFDDNGIITNMATLAEEKGFDGGKIGVEGQGWIEGNPNPCDPDKGEYLPTPEDWKNLMEIWGNANGYELIDDNYYPENDDEYTGYNYYFDGNFNDESWNKWHSDLLLPWGGNISESTCNNEQCTRWNDLIDLWTSQNEEGNVGFLGDDYPYLEYTNYNIVKNDWWYDYGGNSVAMPVRCFVDEEYAEMMIGLPSYTVTYKDGEEILFTKSVKEGKFAHNLTPSDKDGYIFEGWYTDPELENEFDMNTPITKDIALYAKWKEHGVIHKDGYIKITNGDDWVYIKDRNQGVSEDFIDKVNQIHALQDDMCIYEREEFGEITKSLSLNISEAAGWWHLTCPDSYYTQVGDIINIENPSDGDIQNFITYNSIGNFYFRGNNTGVSYFDLELNGDEIMNYNDLTALGFTGGVEIEDGKGWAINPCTEENEYLPSVADWTKAINIRSGVKENETRGEDYNDGGYIGFDKEFLDDIMVYGGGGIQSSYYGPEHRFRFYNHYGWLRANISDNMVGKLYRDMYGNGGSLSYSKVEDYDLISIAYSVRCFLNIEEPEDEEDIPTTPSTPEPTTPSYSGGGGRKATKVTDTKSDTSSHNSAELPQSQTTDPLKSGAQDESDGSSLSREDTALAEKGSLDMSQYNATYTPEQNTAYQFAKIHGITTTSSIKEAKMNTPLTRIQMAKMLSQYAMNVLGKTPDHSAGVENFRDVTNKLNSEYDNAVTLAYQLGIMGINMPNREFRPYDKVTRAEFVTALSRMLYDMDEGKYTSTSQYYVPHMARLYNEGIINVTNPKMQELRGNVMTMLMRTVK